MEDRDALEARERADFWLGDPGDEEPDDPADWPAGAIDDDGFKRGLGRPLKPLSGTEPIRMREGEIEITDRGPEYDLIAAAALIYARLTEIERTLKIVGDVLDIVEARLVDRTETEQNASELLADLAQIGSEVVWNPLSNPYWGTRMEPDVNEALWAGAHALDPVNTLRRRLRCDSVSRAKQNARDFEEGGK